MKYAILFGLLLLTGCARSACELAIDNLQPAPKIPKQASIEVTEKIVADDGGYIMLKGYIAMSKQISAVIDSCKKP